MGLFLLFVRTFLIGAIQDQTSKMERCWMSDKGMQKAVHLLKKEKNTWSNFFKTKSKKKILGGTLFHLAC